MKALILSGGFGTRLRPLSLCVPKPLMPLGGERSIMFHQVEALVRAGVTEIVLAINYMPEIMREHSSKWESDLGIKISIVQENKEPLGTSGAIKNCEEILKGTEPFYVLNADISCDFPFDEMMKFHKNHKGHATILVTKTEEPHKFGVVVYDNQHRVERFVEKPKQFVGDKINAGVYIFDPVILDVLPIGFGSIEREVFPKIAQDGWMYCYQLQSYWNDLGTIKDYLGGHKMFMDHRGLSNIISDSVQVGSNCYIDGSTIGPNCIIGDNVFLKDSIVLEGSTIQNGAYVKDSIVGWDCKVGKWAKLINNTVISLDVTVEPGVVLNNTHVISHKSISDNVFEPNKIIM